MNDSPDQLRSTIAWFVWTMCQIGILILMASRLPLAAKFPQPAENLAMLAMIFTQLVIASVIGRPLLRDVRTFAIAFATAIPMLVLATLLSGQPASHAIIPAITVAAWFGASASIGAIRSDAIRTPMQALMLLLTVGGPVLVYLSWEFGRRPIAVDGWIAFVSPTLGAASTFIHGTSQIWTIVVPIVVIIAISTIRFRQARLKLNETVKTSNGHLKGLVG